MINDNIHERPLFIVGAPRSGTTWLQRLLLSLPQFCGSQESHFFVVFGPALQSFDMSGKPRMQGLSIYWKEPEMADEIRRLWDRTVSPVIGANPDATWFVDKTPAHVFFVHEILRVLPKAGFIHMVRDSRAVVASLLGASSGWGQGWAPRRLSHATHLWKRCVDAGLIAKDEVSEDRFCQVHYENLIANPFDELRSILQFIGTEAPNPVLEKIILENSFERQKAIGGTPFAYYGDRKSAPNSMKEPDGFFRKGKADSWKEDLSLFQQAWVWSRTKELLTKLGYNKKGLINVISTPGEEPRSSAKSRKGTVLQ